MVNNQIPAPEYLTKSDLVRRWACTPSRIEKFIANNKEFPKPVGSIGNGKVKIWTLSSIKKFEEIENISPSYARLFSRQINIENGNK